MYNDIQFHMIEFYRSRNIVDQENLVRNEYISFFIPLGVEVFFTHGALI